MLWLGLHLQVPVCREAHMWVVGLLLLLPLPVVRMLLLLLCSRLLLRP